MKEIVEQIANEIATRESFRPEEFFDRFPPGTHRGEIGKRITDARDIARVMHRVSFRPVGDGSGTLVRVESASGLANQASTIRRRACRAMGRAEGTYELAIEAAESPQQAASLVQRRARLSDLAFNRDRPSPFASARKPGG